MHFQTLLITVTLPNSEWINPFHATGLFLYPLKTSENLWFFDVSRGYRKKPVAWNRLIYEMPLNLHSNIFFNDVILGLLVIHVIATPCKLHKYTERYSIPLKICFFKY